MAVLSITATAVLKSGDSATTAVKTIAAGVTVTQGQALYLLSDGTVGLADANVAAPVNTFFGFALTAGSPGQPCVVLTGDSVGYTLGATLAISPVYLSNTAGAVTQTLGDLSVSKLTVVAVPISTTVAIVTPVAGGTTT